VNTTRAHRHKNGEVSAAQVARVAARLAEATPAQLRVVVVHQPIDVQRPQDEPDRLIGHTAAQDAWAAAGADLVMGGHIHLPYVMPLPGLARPMWAVQAGTAVSHRVRRWRTQLGEPGALARGRARLRRRAVGLRGHRRSLRAGPRDAPATGALNDQPNIRARCALAPAMAPAPTEIATLPAARAASPQANTPGTLVPCIASVRMKAPVGPSSMAQPS
jgi:hypothetical protein